MGVKLVNLRSDYEITLQIFSHRIYKHTLSALKALLGLRTVINGDKLDKLS